MTPVVTNELRTLTYRVRDISTATQNYDSLQWFRSRSGKQGYYEPFTDTAAQPATILGSSQEPHALNGKTLSLRVNGTEIDVVFSSPDPVSSNAAATEITAAGDVQATAESGRVRISSTGADASESVEVLDSEAAIVLGLNGSAVGMDANTTLQAASQYFVEDPHSHKDFWYATRLVHSVNGTLSEMSVPFSAQQLPAIPFAELITGYIRVADLNGKAMPGRRITLSNVFLPNKRSNYGIFRHYRQLNTDRSGYAEDFFIRGSTIDISIDGTGFVRRIEVPEDGDDFDLLDETLVTEDEFGIQHFEVDYPERL